jgi:23S rRNA U2552 (ribose-2'-O)-methylase RlmE/FtsJ
MVVLHEIQQQHKIIAPGDWVLDIGAGPNYYWTELALRLAENEKQSHRVISNDKLEPTGLRSNQVYVKGNFMEEQIRTNIGLKLGERKFDTIMMDASP